MDPTDTDIKNFKRDLLNKLQYKGPSNSSKQTVLLKAFKFYDLNSSGVLSKEDFLKAIARLGVVLSSQQEMDHLFCLFANGNKQSVGYKEFIKWVLEKENQQVQSKDPSEYEDSLDRSVMRESHLYAQRQNLGQIEQKPASKPQSVVYSVRQNYQREVSIQGSRMDTPLKQSFKKLQESIIRTVEPQTHQQAVQLARQKLREGGMRSLLDLAMRLKTLDGQGAHKLPFQTVQRQMPFLSLNQVKLLVQNFAESSGLINYAQLVYCLRGAQSPERCAIISNMFRQLDTSNRQQIPISCLLQKTNQTPQLTKQKFNQSVDLYCSFQGIDDGIFTVEDFEDFFGIIGVYFKGDQDFRAFLLKTFQEEHGSGRSRVSSQRASRRQFDKDDFKPRDSTRQPARQLMNSVHQFLAQTADFAKKATMAQQPQSVPLPPKSSRRVVRIQQEVILVNKNGAKGIDLILLRIRRKLMSRGPRGFLFFQKFLKEIDIDQGCLIDIFNFKKAIAEFRIDITPTETQLIFDVFDQGSGAMNYIRLVQTLKGQVAPKRSSVIQRVWDTVKVNQFETSYIQLKRLFNPRGHPDIHNGRRYEEDLRKELFESINCIQDLDGLRSEEISKETFVEYLQTLSASIEDEQLFETILTSVWKLSPATKIQDLYAGSKLKFDYNRKQNAYLMDHHRAVVSGQAIYQSAPFGTFKNLNEYYRK